MAGAAKAAVMQAVGAAAPVAGVQAVRGPASAHLAPAHL
jgi:hypothetical protein